MSVQFGRWNFDGKPVGRQELDRIRPMLAPYGPDAESVFCRDNVGILLRAFHTTKESRREQHPHVLPSGAILTWDGRLDNREELRGLLGGQLATDTTDPSLVAAAYERWSTNAFARFIGDWALSLWDPGNQSLVLAKDFVGTRHLYYHIDKRTLTWSTLLDPLVLFAGRTFELCEEYIAGWLSFYPATQLTPYVGIHSVPPSSSVQLRSGKATIQQYWDFNPGVRIRYRTDAEYEEHFRTVFAEAVRRRLRADKPVLAELSGGMDSSSIVCMADVLRHNGDAEIRNLDTVSYYNDSEPNWNERPYFTKIEEKRGRAGCHIDVSKRELFSFSLASDDFAPTPGSRSRITEADKQFGAFLTSQDSRVVLSGLGGDEVAGGVPTPMPELESLLAGAHFKQLAHQLKVWALSMRKPWWFLLFETIRAFVPVDLLGVPKHKQAVPWLNSDFVRRNRLPLRGYESRLHLFGPPPTFQENLSTLDALRRQLGCETQSHQG